MRTDRFILRHGTPRDAPRIRRFFVENGHRFNADRGDDVMLEAIQNRDVFLVEREADGEIVGVSALFHYQDGAYAEAGASRITGPIGGFGIHMLMHYVRSCHLCLNNSSVSGYFGIVASDNEPSKKNISQAGFERWSTPDPAMLQERESLLGRSLDLSQKLLYKLPSSVFVDHACKLLEVARRNGWDTDGEPATSPVVTMTRPSREGGDDEALELVLKVEPITYHWRDLVRLCNQEPGLYQSA